MRVIAIAAFMIVISMSTMGQAAKVTGKITISPELQESIDALEHRAAESGRSYYWNEPNGIAPVRPPRINTASDIAVVIDKEGAPAPGPSELTTVKVRAGSIDPTVTVVRPGSTIRFRNVDPFDHALYCPTVKNFNPEQQSNGSFRPIEFSDEGVFEIKCKLFSHFKAYVLVTKAAQIVAVDKDGVFTIPELEDGKYVLKVFHGGKWIHEESFEVNTAKSREMKIEVALKPETKSGDQAQPVGKEDKPAGEPK